MPFDSSVTADELWLASLRATGRSPATITNYHYSLGRLRDWRRDADLTSTTRLEAMSFAKHLSESLAPASVAATGARSGCSVARAARLDRS